MRLVALVLTFLALVFIDQPAFSAKKCAAKVIDLDLEAKLKEARNSGPAGREAVLAYAEAAGKLDPSRRFEDQTIATLNILLALDEVDEKRWDFWADRFKRAASSLGEASLAEKVLDAERYLYGSPGSRDASNPFGPQWFDDDGAREESAAKINHSLERLRIAAEQTNPSLLKPTDPFQLFVPIDKSKYRVRTRVEPKEPRGGGGGWDPGGEGL